VGFIPAVWPTPPGQARRLFGVALVLVASCEPKLFPGKLLRPRKFRLHGRLLLKPLPPSCRGECAMSNAEHRGNQPAPQSLAEMLSRYLHQQAAAHSQGMCAPAPGEVIP